MRSAYLFIPLMMSGAVLAQSGADALLNATGTEIEDAVTVKAAASSKDQKNDQKFKITDDFLQTLFVEWKATGTQNFEVNRWVSLVLRHDFVAAAHLWTSIQESLPADMKPTANVTWAYLAWRMNIPQTFISAWQEARLQSGSSRAFQSLEQTIAKEKPAEWVFKNKPYLDPTLSQELMTNATQGFALELAAWSARFNLDQAATVLAKLPLGHARSLDLAQTAILSYARKNELGEAGKLLKRRVEPEIEKIGDAKLLAKHYLNLGRLLYQSGSLEAAEAFYARVPKGLPEFLPARTERTWALLRLGRVAELRGELESLSHGVIADTFLPEVSLVRAVSNLKLCRYDDVAADFKFFIETNNIWAQKISKALAAESTPGPDMKDPKIANVELALKQRNAEEKEISKLKIDSMKAALPAVGEQIHWVKAHNQIEVAQAADQRSLMAEKRRFWKNREIVLAEAIRKMKFVKVEAMSQVRMANADNGQGNDVISTVQASAGKQSYPFEGVYWPDEMFHLHAQATTRCGGTK